MRRRITLASAIVLGLAGCGGQQLAPPGMPDVPQIQAEMQVTAAVPPGQVHEFYSAGLFLVQRQCGVYYDMAVMNALSNAQTQGQFNALAGLAAGALGLAGVGGPGVAAAGLGASFINTVLTNQAQNSLAGTDPAGMYTLTTTAQQTLINAMAEPVSVPDAKLAIYAVYRQCSPAGIQAMKEQAINQAPSHLVVTGQSPASVRAGGKFMAPARSRAIPGIRVQ